jgi:transcriptional regulator with XRE-family HTH domain
MSGVDKEMVGRERRRFGINRRQLAAESGLTVQTVIRIEKSGNASDAEVLALAHALGVMPKDLRRR